MKPFRLFESGKLETPTNQDAEVPALTHRPNYESL